MTNATNGIGTVRADLIGGMRRPDALLEARARRDEGSLPDADFQTILDGAVRDLVAKEVAHGLPVLTDGEFRRHNFQESFGGAVSGFDAGPYVYQRSGQQAGAWMSGRVESGLSGPGPAILNRRPVKQRLKLERNLILDEYLASSKLTDRPVKVALIGPDRISQRFEWESSGHVYADMDAFLADVVAIERQMIGELVAAGCTYVQIDAPGFTAYVDPPSLERMRARGEHPQEKLMRSIRAENAVIEGFSGVTFGIHVCRGNGLGWHREGFYDPMAEQLFAGLNHERLLLEYDSERAGTFEPLRFVRKGTIAVLGLVSTKLSQIESVDDLRRRVDDACRYLPIEQLAISPQCGFGSLISEGEQWQKLDNMMSAAGQIWGD